jgi:hypothetical protein
MAMAPLAAGDWFAIPLRFGLFATGRAAAVDPYGTILGYFFARFFERIPTGADVRCLTPGDADVIGSCSRHGLRADGWPVIAADPRTWPIPVFRTIEPATGTMRWTTFETTDLARERAFADEPADAGARNWGLPMDALAAAPMSWVDVEFALWRQFRVFQNGQHRKYIAAMQRALSATG